MTDPLPPREKVLTVFEKEIERADNTIQRYQQDIPEWLDYLEQPGELSFDDRPYEREPKAFWNATPGNLKRYLKGLLSDGYAPGTVDLRRASISVFHQTMAEISEDPDIGFLDLPDEIPNPSDGMESTDKLHLYKKRERERSRNSSTEEAFTYLTAEEVKKLAKNATSPKLRNEVIIRLLFHTGMRRAELADVRLKDLSLDERHIEVNDTKNNQSRDAFFPEKLKGMIQRWIAVGRESYATADSPYLFNTEKADQIHPDAVNKVVKKAAENAGLQTHDYDDTIGRSRSKITAHTLRHSCAIAMLKNGNDTRTIQKILGHSNIETTEVYLELTEDDLKSRYQKYGTPSL
jgi:integrase/recombinase XerD